jgi:SAM-dependent methyltransferase
MSGPTCFCCQAALPAARLYAPDRLHGTPGDFAVAVCPRCGTGRTLPDMSPGELASAYPEAYLPHASAPSCGISAVLSGYLSRARAHRALATPPLDVTRDLAPGRALDVGCGRGDLGAALIARGWQVTGLDPAPGAVVEARRRGLDARAGKLTELDLEPDTYDLAVFQHSLEHTVDPVADLRAAAKALRPHGFVAITVPNFGSRQARWFGGRWFTSTSRATGII